MPCIVATPTGPALICNVGDLAAEEQPAARLPAGRYEVDTNDLGDRLLVGDRLRDECTCPIIDITTAAQPPGSATMLGLDPRCPLHGNRPAEG